MAGIGFRLRRLAEREGLWGFFASYAAAAAIMAGPWILTILTVGCVSFLGQGLERFEAYVTHVYQVSLITVGFLQFPATRHLADLLYEKNLRAVFPSFNAGLALSVLVSTTLGLLWAVTSPGPVPLEKALVVTLLNIVTVQWFALVFLVTVHRYRSILLAFSVGGLLSVLSALTADGPQGNLSALFGFTLGQALTVGILCAALMREYPAYTWFNFGAVGWIVRAPSLALAGGLFYLGSFADKLVYRYGWWISDSPEVGELVVAPWLYISHPYESLTFLAQLTIIPALAVFYIRVETGFFEVYKAFYNTIDERGTLAELEYIKAQILAQMAAAARMVYSSQGVITVFCVLVAPELIPGLTLADAHADILRASLFASFFGILLLLTVVIYLYFEFYREACWMAALYLVLNGGFTALILWLNVDVAGWGAALASFLACLSSAWLLWQRVDDLLFRTFSKSPVETLPAGGELGGVGRFHFHREQAG